MNSQRERGIGAFEDYVDLEGNFDTKTNTYLLSSYLMLELRKLNNKKTIQVITTN